MEKKPFIAQSSLVPVLACIAAILFSANFYQFMKHNFKKWWGWDFRCPTEEVCVHDHTFMMHRHSDHRHHFDIRRHKHDRKKRHTIVLDFDRSNMDQAQQDLHRAEEALQRNLERAMRDLERLNERMEWDATVAADLERLENEVRIKAENLGRLQREMESRGASDEEWGNEEAVQELHFESDNEDVTIIIKKQ